MTTTTASPPRLLPAWLKSTLLAAAVFALCWGAAIAYWRTAENAPATVELVLALLVLPLGLLIGSRAINKHLISQSATAVAPAASPANESTTAAPQVLQLAILATALRSPFGSSTEELAAAIAEGKARADLDPELVDDKGFPITAARRDDALDEAFQEEFIDWLALNEMTELHFSGTQWRGLTLGTAVLRDLVSEALPALIPKEGRSLVLRLIPILPSEWTVEHRSAMGMWFEQQAAQSGWPLADMYCVDLQAHRSYAVTEMLYQLMSDASAHDSRFVALVIACDSRIDQETVNDWEADGVLHTTSRSHGLTPGEGAAGILLTDAQQVQTIAGMPYAVLEAFVKARHDVSIDDSRRTNIKLLANLAERSCKAAAVESADVAMIVADTDDCMTRMSELMGMASGTFPHLEDAAQVARVGTASGACGAVPGITALALAHHHALACGAPVLYVSNGEAQHRCAALVRPTPST
jgi:hypothetical protein